MLTGVWGAGKTSVLQRITGLLHRAEVQSLVTMPQAATITTHTYRPGSPHEHLLQVLSWLETLTAFVEDLDRRFQSSTLPQHRFAPQWTPTCLLEGLGFDLPLHGLPVHREDLLSVERRLATVGVKLVVLKVPDVLAQSVVSTRAHRGPKWTRYLDRFGSNDEERARCIERLQETLLQWAESSPMPLHVIDTATRDWDGYAREIVEIIT